MMIPLGCSVPKNSSQFTNKKQKMRGNYLHLFLSPIKPKIDNVLEQLHTLHLLQLTPLAQSLTGKLLRKRNMWGEELLYLRYQ